ncbi:MAG: hypothetical protein H5T84_00145, partial [Thermoleophilia bacterium]|nr:hypothetical protein [Thermoleophilia bacterium]
KAPYDGILVTAAAPHVPSALLEQLAPGGRLVIPVSAGYAQDLKLIERLPEEISEAEKPGSATPQYRETSVLGCVFVPLIGEQGYRQ